MQDCQCHSGRVRRGPRLEGGSSLPVYYSVCIYFFETTRMLDSSLKNSFNPYKHTTVSLKLNNYMLTKMNKSLQLILFYMMLVHASDTPLRGVMKSSEASTKGLDTTDQDSSLIVEDGRELAGTARLKVIFYLKDNASYCLDWTKTELWDKDETTKLGEIKMDTNTCTSNNIGLKHVYQQVRINTKYVIKMTSKIQGGEKKTKKSTVYLHSDNVVLGDIGANNFCFRQGGSLWHNNRLDGKDGGSVSKPCWLAKANNDGWMTGSGVFGRECELGVTNIFCAEQPFDK